MLSLLLRVSFVTICFVCLVDVACAEVQEDVVLNPESAEVRIAYHATVLVDPQRKYSTTAILRGDLDHRFQPLDTRALPVNGAWFKFTLRNDSNSRLTRVLSYDSPMMREAQLYRAPLEKIEHATAGAGGTLNIFSITLNSFAIESYYLFLDAPLADYNLAIQEPLHHLQGILNQTQTSHLFYGASLGIFLYALILLATTRMPIYLWFASSILAYTLTWSMRDGSAMTYLPPLDSDVRDSLPWIFLIFSCMASARFFTVFLNLKDQWPITNNISHGFIAVWLCMLPLDFFLQTNFVVELLTLVNFAFVGFQMSVLLPLALQKQRDAALYLGGYSISLAVFTVFLLVHVGAIDAYTSAGLDAVLSFGPHFGQFIWMIVMTLALGERFRALSDSKDEATRDSQSKSTFLATMSHEIRTPMNGVLGMAELLSNTKMTAQQKNYVSTISSSASTLLTILDDILDYSKIQSGKLELERIPINLYQFISDTVMVFAAISREKKVPLVINIDETLPMEIWGDPTRLRQIMVNLLGNAFKFTATGHITIRLCEQKGDLIIAIEDTGIGISAEDQDRVFSTFSQADTSTSRKFGGSGLGLSICKDLLTVMDGSIGLESEPGVGSTFIVRIPIASADSQTIIDAVPTEVRYLSVLLFEPIDAKRLSIQKTMESWGIKTRTATTLDAARQIMGSDANLDAVLTGIPAMLADLKHNIGGIEHPKIIQLATASNHRHEDDGVDYIVEEPVAPGALLTAFEALFCPEGEKAAPTEIEQVNSKISELSVLVAEDNEVNQRVIRGLLNRLGVEPTIANNGEEALSQFRDHRGSERPFDLILMDCEMPQLDGYEATRMIRELEADQGDHVDIVALTASVLPEHRKKAADMGMDEFLTKPIRLADLQQLLGSL